MQEHERIDADEFLGVGVYDLTSAARILRCDRQRLARWFTMAPSHRWLEPAHGRKLGKTAISFHDLIEARVACTFLEQGVHPSKIRSAWKLLHEEFNTDAPFAHEGLKLFIVDGKRLTIAAELEGLLVDTSTGQSYLDGIMGQYLRTITYDHETGLAKQWLVSEDVLIDPKLRYGSPLYAPTLTRLDILRDALQARGGDVGQVAAEYDVAEAAVETAKRFYGLRAA